jgi:hypothetical protein
VTFRAVRGCGRGWSFLVATARFLSPPDILSVVIVVAVCWDPPRSLSVNRSFCRLFSLSSLPVAPVALSGLVVACRDRSFCRPLFVASVIVGNSL